MRGIAREPHARRPSVPLWPPLPARPSRAAADAIVARPSPAPGTLPASAKRLSDRTGFSMTCQETAATGARLASGRNVGQPDHVLVDTIAGHQAKPRPGRCEEWRAVAEHDGMEVELIFIDETKLGQVSRAERERPGAALLGD